MLALLVTSTFSTATAAAQLLKNMTPSEHDQQLNSVIVITDDNDTLKLGNGYNSNTQQEGERTNIFVSALSDGGVLGDLDGDGFDDSAVPVGNVKSSISAIVDLSYQGVLNQINVSGSAQLNLPSVTVSGSVDFAMETAVDSYSNTYTIIGRVSPKKMVLLPTEEAENGVGTHQGLQPTQAMHNWVGILGVSDALVNQIGDEFIQAVELGSWVMVTLRFDYLNEQDKKEIGGTLAVSMSGVEIEGEITWADIKNAETVNVTLRAHQVGGNPGELVNVLPDNFQSCTLAAPEACLDLFTNAVNYVKVDYPAQFVLPSDYDRIKYYTSRYDESGPALAALMPTINDTLSFSSKIALKKMTSEWAQAKLDVKRVNNLINRNPATMTATHRTELDQIKQTVNDIIDDLESEIDTCKNGAPDDCNIAWNAASWQQSYDKSLLSL
ncbi:MAG: hypothetical protein HRT35_00930 [Algicola sp.]|nr:hypothetical protein [Algicola sp.]